jgi:hypothetical protein
MNQLSPVHCVCPLMIFTSFFYRFPMGYFIVNFLLASIKLLTTSKKVSIILYLLFQHLPTLFNIPFQPSVFPSALSFNCILLFQSHLLVFFYSCVYISFSCLPILVFNLFFRNYLFHIILSLTFLSFIPVSTAGQWALLL